MKLNDDHLYFPTGDGHFISEKQRRINEIIRDYDSNLQLQYIPVENRSPQDYAFRVVDVTPGKKPYVVAFAQECDERLLAKIIAFDNKHRNVFNFMDAHNAAIELYEQKKRKEERMEMHEFMYSALRHRKFNYMHNGINYGVRR